VVDLPFLSYQVSAEDALRSAGRVMKETGAGAVKLEGGGPDTAESVRRLVAAGIPVMAHVGFTPQSVHALGGYRVQGREEEGKRVMEDALRLQEAGAFSVVLELVPAPLAEEVTGALEIPTIGIGAGGACDGQVLVLHDMLGLNRDFRARFLRRFAEMGDGTEQAVRDFGAAVRAGEFPAAEHGFE
jgi:3-methyl-2-oxobutanoate hydroxymethyltransferase